MIKTVDSVVNRYIKNTPRRSYVKTLRVKICEISDKLRRFLKVKDARVYITTRSLKHLYDKRLAEEFDLIINNLESFVSSPQKIFKNKKGKTGDFCLYSEVGKQAYFTILDTSQKSVYIVSIYRLSDVDKKRKNYLKSYELVGDWKGDLPSSYPA